MQASSTMTKDVTPFRALTNPLEESGFLGLSKRSRTRLDTERFLDYVPPLLKYLSKSEGPRALDGIINPFCSRICNRLSTHVCVRS